MLIEILSIQFVSGLGASLLSLLAFFVMIYRSKNYVRSISVFCVLQFLIAGLQAFNPELNSMLAVQHILIFSIGFLTLVFGWYILHERLQLARKWVLTGFLSVSVLGVSLSFIPKDFLSLREDLISVFDFEKIHLRCEVVESKQLYLQRNDPYKVNKIENTYLITIHANSAKVDVWNQPNFQGNYELRKSAIHYSLRLKHPPHEMNDGRKYSINQSFSIDRETGELNAARTEFIDQERESSYRSLGKCSLVKAQL
jgi:hypothetical protein